MASTYVGKAEPVRLGAKLVATVADQGSAAHPYFASDTLMKGPDAARNLADAVNFLAALHGRHPGIVDLAGTRSVEDGARVWLTLSATAMTGERDYLARLAVAAGPLPSTPGGAGAENVVQAQRTALATLAQSERRGCALGAALAFALDWHRLRRVMDAAALRFGLEPAASTLLPEESIAEVADSVGQEMPGIERAILFGAQQIAIQHRGLWDLLDARASARFGY